MGAGMEMGTGKGEEFEGERVEETGRQTDSTWPLIVSHPGQIQILYSGKEKRERKRDKEKDADPEIHREIQMNGQAYRGGS